MAKLDLFIAEFDVTNKQLLWGGVAVAVALYIIYQQSKKAIIETVQEVTKKVNPVSNENIFYETFTGAYKAVTGSDEDLGSDIYDLLHPKVQADIVDKQYGTVSPDYREYLEIQGD